jgi:hypothetical protein
MAELNQELELLAERHRLGQLSPADVETLARLCRDPECARAWALMLQDHADWEAWSRREEGAGEDADAFTRQVLASWRSGTARPASSRFLKSVCARARTSQPPRRKPAGTPAWVYSLVAAAAVVALVLFAAWPGNRGARGVQPVVANQPDQPDGSAVTEPTSTNARENQEQQAAEPLPAESEPGWRRLVQRKDALHAAREKAREAERALTAAEQALEERHASTSLETSAGSAYQEEMAALRQAMEARKQQAEAELREAHEEFRKTAALAQPAENGTVLWSSSASALSVERAGQRLDATEGFALRAGDRLLAAQAGGQNACAARVLIGPGVELHLAAGAELILDGDLELRLQTGRLYADIELGNLEADGGAETYLNLRTPHAQVLVTGTRFELYADQSGTQLRMEEGSVSFTGSDPARGLTVTGGYASRVARGGQPAVPERCPPHTIWRGARGPLPFNVVLGPDQGATQHALFQKIQDEQALSGEAWECTQNPWKFDYRKTTEENLPNSQVWLTYRVEARGGVDYFIWVRALTLVDRADPRAKFKDGLILELQGGTFLGPDGQALGSTARSMGYSQHHGYAWVGYEGDRNQGALPLRVRFPRDGTHEIRVHPYEPPIRLDTLWISAEQATQPPAGHDPWSR